MGGVGVRFIDAWTRVLLRREAKKPIKKEEQVLKGYCQLLDRYVQRCPLGSPLLRGINFCGWRGTRYCPFQPEEIE